MLVVFWFFHRLASVPAGAPGGEAWRCADDGTARHRRELAALGKRRDRRAGAW